MRQQRATHYDYEAPGDAERNAAGEGVDALGAALATLAADEREGEDEEDDDGNVEAALEARGEALSRLRTELAAAAASLMHTAWASDVARAVASHDTAREHTLRATEAAAQRNRKRSRRDSPPAPGHAPRRECFINRNRVIETR